MNENEYELIGIDYILNKSKFMNEINSKAPNVEQIINKVLSNELGALNIGIIEQTIKDLSDEAIEDLISYCKRKLVELEFTLYYGKEKDEVMMDIFMFNIASDAPIMQTSAGMGNIHDETVIISVEVFQKIFAKLLEDRISFQFMTDDNPMDDVTDFLNKLTDEGE